MPVATRTFRVFVSSTFEDLQEERDALQRDVYPKVRILCEHHGARFQAIDLRWGVRDEAGLDQQTMEICLREIQRCQHTGIKPNFIVLLGQRYGWRPLPSHIEEYEFESVRERIADPEDRALVESWYRRDDNALPAQYRLKPRVGEWVQPESWVALEAQLRRILLDAVRPAGLPEQALVKYESSATHQEILTGLGATPEDRRHVFVFCRNVPDESCDPDIVALKRFLRAQLPADNILSYEPGNFRELCDRVQQTVRAVIESEAAGFESRTALALEIEAHDRFARDRALVFGREAVLDVIGEHVRADDERPLVLHGASGSGKSAVMAQASERVGSTLASAVVVRRFIGVSPESSSGATLLRSLCEQIGEAYGMAGELPVDFNGVARAFRERLTRATSARPLVVFLDALDQLEKDAGRSLAWFSGAFPQHCRIVISTTNVAAVLEECRVIELEALPQADAAKALDHWFEEVHRSLQPAQRERLLAAYIRCGLPLYLKLAFEQARGWTSYQAAEECPIGEGVEGVIDTLFDHLSLEANHGPLLVSRSLGYLAAARYGLTEDEALEVLSADEDVWSDFERRAHHTPPERRLPVIVWSRLFLDLEPYLAERSAPGGSVISFYHRQLAEQTAARFLDSGQRKQRHALLAGYFAAQPYWFDAEHTRPNGRKAAELIHHYRGAGQVDEAVASLTEMQFLAAKCGAGLVVDLQDDYSATIALLPEAKAKLRDGVLRQAEAMRWTTEIIEYARAWNTRRNQTKDRHSFSHWMSRLWSGRQDRFVRGAVPSALAPVFPAIPESVKPKTNDQIADEIKRITTGEARLDKMFLFQNFVKGESHALMLYAARPGFVVQQAYNSAKEGPVAGLADECACEAPQLLLRRRPEFNPLPATIRLLQGHNDVVHSVSVTPDARLAVTASYDKTLRVWDLETGQFIRLLEGHTDFVWSVSMTPDGRLAVSGGWDKTLRVWDLETGVCLRTLEAHEDAVFGVSMTPDGLRAVSASWDKTLRVWDLETGACLRALRGHSDRVESVEVTPDGRLAVSASVDKTLRVWDLETGTCMHTLRGHGEEIMSVSLTPDGRFAVSSSKDKMLRVWDVKTGSCLQTLQGHTGWVHSVSVTADGRLAVSSSHDRSLQTWDLEKGTCLRKVQDYGEMSLSVTPDGRRALSGSSDNTARLWDLENGTCFQTLERHNERVTDLAVMPDGKRAISASKDKKLKVWDLDTGRVLRTLEGHSAAVNGLAVTPDGRLAVSASSDKTLRVWDLETGACLRALEGHRGWVGSVSVTPDGRQALSAGGDYSDRDNALRVWDLETGACLRTLEGHKSQVNGVGVTPNGRRAVSASNDGTLRVWNLETGACVRTMEGHTNAVWSVSVTRDGQRAVSVSGDKTVRVWDLEIGTCLRTLLGHSASVRHVSVTPDGRHAVSASEDKTLRMWDMDTGQCVALTHGNAPWTAVATLTGAWLVAGSSTGEIALFDLREPKA